MKSSYLLLVLLACIHAVNSGSQGFDISGSTCDGSSWVSSTQFPCFKSKGMTFTVIQAWQGGYGQTTSIAYCASQAAKAGLSVSLYVYACPNCAGNTPPQTVFKNLAQNLAKQGVQYTYMYFDIEQCSGSCWYSSTSQNANFLSQAISGAESGGAKGKVAIYANANSWSSVMGTNSSFSKYPLWYAHYDNSASCSDFQPFAGWTKPHMKQFRDSSSVGCFSNVDMDVLC